MERLTMKLAWVLPRSLVMWCAIRIMAHASQGQWGTETPASIDMMTMLDRWGGPHAPSPAEQMKQHQGEGV